MDIYIFFDAEHIPGILNDTADGLSRWSRGSIATDLMALRPDVPWHGQVIGDAGNRLCSEILDSSLPDDPLRDRLSRLTKDILGPPFGFAVR